MFLNLIDYYNIVCYSWLIFFIVLYTTLRAHILARTNFGEQSKCRKILILARTYFGESVIFFNFGESENSFKNLVGYNIKRTKSQFLLASQLFFLFSRELILARTNFGEVLIFLILARTNFGEFWQNSPNSPKLVLVKICALLKGVL